MEPKDRYESHLNLLFERGIDLDRRIIYINEEIEEGHSFNFDAALTLMESSSKRKITVKVNCPGGDIEEANAIVARMLQSTCMIETVGYGKIMSAALLILAAGKSRKMSKLAIAMHHGASYGMDVAKHENIKDLVTQMEKHESSFNKLLEELTGTDFMFWAKSSKYADTYLSAQECLKLGLVDEIF